MNELQLAFDKFIFRVAADRRYSADGVWARPEGDRVLVGVSDFVQQRNGDIAFAEMVAVGTVLSTGDFIGSLETIKVNLDLDTPVSGTVVAVNELVEKEPELVNQDPYGAGWLLAIRPDDWSRDGAALLDPQGYLVVIRDEAEAEANES